MPVLDFRTAGNSRFRLVVPRAITRSRDTYTARNSKRTFNRNCIQNIGSDGTNLIFDKRFTKTCMKMKEIEPIVGAWP